MKESVSKKNTAVKFVAGRVGNIRYYTRGGKTYTRTIHSSVTNKRSDEQMRHRCKVAHIALLYRNMKTLLAKTFEDVTPLVSTFNLFFKYATHCTPIYLTKSQVKNVCCVAAPYILSKGSLQSIDYHLKNKILTTNLSLGGLVIDEKTTVGQLSVALVKNNADLVKYDDSISFVAVTQEGTKAHPYVNVKGWTVSLEKGSSVHLFDVAEEGFASAYDCLAMSKVPTAGCYGWVLSRYKTETKVSTQYLFNCNTKMTDYYSSEKMFQQACKSYKTSNPKKDNA